VDRELTPREREEAERIEDVLLATMRAEAKRMAAMLASKENGELLGATEFELRDRVHRLGAVALDAALEARKKRGTADRR